MHSGFGVNLIFAYTKFTYMFDTKVTFICEIMERQLIITKQSGVLDSCDRERNENGYGSVWL